MKKKAAEAWLWIMGGIILVVIGLAIFTMAFDNSSNAFGHSKDAIEWFEDTGITVVNSENKVYHIVADPNGWLYYSSCHDGDLTPVLNAIGTPTKDASIFED